MDLWRSAAAAACLQGAKKGGHHGERVASSLSLCVRNELCVSSTKSRNPRLSLESTLCDTPFRDSFTSFDIVSFKASFFFSSSSFFCVLLSRGVPMELRLFVTHGLVDKCRL